MPAEVRRARRTMKISRKLLYLVSFVGLALSAAPCRASAGPPSAGARCLRRSSSHPWPARRAWSTAVPGRPPSSFSRSAPTSCCACRCRARRTSTASAAQVGFYVEQLQLRRTPTCATRSPSTWRPRPMRLLLSLFVYPVAGLAAFVALSLRKAAAGHRDRPRPAGIRASRPTARQGHMAAARLRPAGRLPADAVALAAARALEVRRTPSPAPPRRVIATLLALSLLGTTSVSASKPWGNWRAWGIAGPRHAPRASTGWPTSPACWTRPPTRR